MDQDEESSLHKLFFDTFGNCLDILLLHFSPGRHYKDTLLLQLLVVLMVLAAIIIYRVTVLYAMSIVLGYGKAKMFILVTAGALQVIAIAVLNAVSYLNLNYDIAAFS